MLHPNGKYYRFSYGEARLFEKENITLKNGEMVEALKQHNIAPRMTRKEAVEYYNKKLDKIWLDSLCDSIPANKKLFALNILLGRNTWKL